MFYMGISVLKKGVCMINKVSGNYYVSRPAKADNNFVDKTFEYAQKGVRNSQVETRWGDWGLYAAYNCLAKQLVSASPEESEDIMARMTFIQNQMNENLKVDGSLNTQEMSDKCLKYDAKAKLYPAQAELIKAGTDSASQLISDTKGIIKDIKPVGDAAKVLQLVA